MATHPLKPSFVGNFDLKYTSMCKQKKKNESFMGWQNKLSKTIQLRLKTGFAFAWFFGPSWMKGSNRVTPGRQSKWFRMRDTVLSCRKELMYTSTRSWCTCLQAAYVMFTRHQYTSTNRWCTCLHAANVMSTSHQYISTSRWCTCLQVANVHVYK